MHPIPPITLGTLICNIIVIKVGFPGFISVFHTHQIALLAVSDQFSIWILHGISPLQDSHELGHEGLEMEYYFLLQTKCQSSKYHRCYFWNETHCSHLYPMFVESRPFDHVWLQGVINLRDEFESQSLYPRKVSRNVYSGQNEEIHKP
jgi:hypothetical protein